MPSQRLQAEPWLREYGRTGGLPYHRVRADGRITISESTGRRTDRHLKRVQEECWLRVNGGTGRMPAQRKLANGWIAGLESKGRRADLCLKVDVLIGGSPSQRIRAECLNRVNGRTGGSPAHRVSRMDGSPSKRVLADRWISISESTG